MAVAQNLLDRFLSLALPAFVTIVAGVLPE
jgi:hypothetical protein